MLKDLPYPKKCQIKKIAIALDLFHYLGDYEGKTFMTFI